MSTLVLDAVMKNSLVNVQFALKKGGNIEERWENGSTPLMFAAQNGNSEILAFLLERGADVNKTDYGGNSSLIFASNKGHTEIVNALLKHNADINHTNSFDDTALIHAARNGHFKIVESLLKYYTNPRSSGALLSNVNHTNRHWDTALNIASNKGHKNIIEILLRYGANPYFRNINFMDAFDADKKGYLNDILNIKHVDPDLTPLMVAAKMKNNMLLSYYIGKSKGLNVVDSEGRTALHHAIINNQISAFKILMESGIDWRIKDGNGKIALDYFRDRGEYLSVIPTDLIKLIIESI